MKTISMGAKALIASTLLAWGAIATADAYGECITRARAAASVEYNKVLLAGMPTCKNLGEVPGAACVAAVVVGATKQSESKFDLEKLKCR